MICQHVQPAVSGIMCKEGGEMLLVSDAYCHYRSDSARSRNLMLTGAKSRKRYVTTPLLLSIFSEIVSIYI